MPRRGNEFPLSPGERAGVRVSVKLIIPKAYNRIETRYYPPLSVRVHGEGECIPHPITAKTQLKAL